MIAPDAGYRSLEGFSRAFRSAYLTGSGWIDVMFDAAGRKPGDDTYRRVQGEAPDDMIRRFEGFHRAYRAFVQKVRAVQSKPTCRRKLLCFITHDLHDQLVTAPQAHLL